MISSTSVYDEAMHPATRTFHGPTQTWWSKGLKMQWTPEHAQWAEQHFDITSTTRSPAHKAEAYRGHLQRTYQYAWANDDISALTASNLLKKYAEKYSGILEGPNERVVLSAYAEAGPGLVNGRKNDDSWQPALNSDGVYSMNCVTDVISASKPGVSAALPPADVSASIGSSPGVASNLTEPSYSSSTCGSHPVASLHSGLPSQEYATGYNGSYLHSSYSSQSASALSSPHPSPLHSSGLLQPPPPPPPPSLVPGYNAGSPNISSYNYTPAGYPPQTGVGPGYSPSGAPPPSAYLPSGIPAPTPLPPTTVPSYSYQTHSLAPIAPTPLNSSSANSLKRKAFYMTGQGEMDSSYGNFNYSQQRSTQSPMYRMPDNSVSNASRGNGFDRSGDASSLAFKPTKQLMSSEQQRKFNSQSSRSLTPPSYSSAKNSLGGSRSGEPFGKFSSPIMGEPSEEHRQHLSHPAQGPGIRTATSSTCPADEQLKNTDQHLVELVTNEIVSQAPPVDWSDIAGLELAKATIKEEVLWPMLRPDVFSGLTALPRSILFFGPQGTGKMLLGRCIASQLGATFFRLSGSALVTKWLGEGEKIVHTSFLIARCRQPSVIFVSEIDMLLSSQVSEESPVNRIKTELLMQLDSVLTSAEDQIVVICSTSKPEEIDESVRRYFMKRLLIPLPDSTARHQIIIQLLSQHNYCLSDKEVALLVQRTEGFSGLDVTRLCQEAAVGPLHTMQGPDLSAIMPSQLRPVTYPDFENVFCKIQPSISQKELDTYTEWNKMFGCSQ
ncbi:fidgetin isoform X2 [Polypterus senegalus]|uniref:fidgetin isoform X2 n=1 Tax=Polypterus senegalus TaxID=55291 RepID=UPI00196405AD|nr:fidgetin isoform X2 [Polypterus senegalus]